MVANLSRFVAVRASSTCASSRGLVPDELFGRTPFPPIGDAAYLLTLGPHGFYWFALTGPTAAAAADAPAVPTLAAPAGWTDLIDGPGRDDLELVLPAYFNNRNPGRPGATVTSCRVLSSLALGPGEPDARLVAVRLEFDEGLALSTLLPLTFVPDGAEIAWRVPPAEAAVVRVRGGQAGVVCDALAVPGYLERVIDMIAQGRTIHGDGYELVGVPLPGMIPAAPADETPPVVLLSERHNPSARFGERVVLKPFRRVEEGLNPDVEVTRYLTERQLFVGIAPVVGYVEGRRRGGGEPYTLAALHKFVPNHGDAWQMTLDHLSQFFERVAARTREHPAEPPASDEELLDGFLPTARLLGQRTADLQLALAAGRDEPAFAPEPFSRTYQRSVYQSLRNFASTLLRRAARPGDDWPEAVRTLAARLVAGAEALQERFAAVRDGTFRGQRIRAHGDYHLGQLLATGNDFVLTDFEGNNRQSIGARRIKRSPLADVAAMVRSFDYALGASLHGLGVGRNGPPGLIREEDVAALEPWAAAWREAVAREYVAAYLEVFGPTRLLPETADGRARLLEALMLERALIEADGDLTHRPAWAFIPLEAVLRLVACRGDGASFCV